MIHNDLQTSCRFYHVKDTKLKANLNAFGEKMLALGLDLYLVEGQRGLGCKKFWRNGNDIVTLLMRVWAWGLAAGAALAAVFACGGGSRVIARGGASARIVSQSGFAYLTVNLPIKEYLNA